jgi:Helix-turn-helix domain
MTAPTIQAQLKTLRTDRGFALAYVSKMTRIPVDSLQLIEDGDLASVTGNIYQRSFCRQYATFLGIDADDMVQTQPPNRSGRTLTKTYVPFGTEVRIRDSSKPSPQAAKHHGSSHRAGQAIALSMVLGLGTLFLGMQYKTKREADMRQAASQHEALGAGLKVTAKKATAQGNAQASL